MLTTGNKNYRYFSSRVRKSWNLKPITNDELKRKTRDNIYEFLITRLEDERNVTSAKKNWILTLMKTQQYKQYVIRHRSPAKVNVNITHRVLVQIFNHASNSFQHSTCFLLCKELLTQNLIEKFSSFHQFCDKIDSLSIIEHILNKMSLTLLFMCLCF